MAITLNEPALQPLSNFGKHGADIFILRLDQVHPTISGNKWYKLQGYLQQATAEKKMGLATMGGPYSNHLYATAALAYHKNLKSEAWVNGAHVENNLSHTLKACQKFGMKLHFIERNDYRKLRAQKLPPHNMSADFQWIPEGGSGPLGLLGCKEILQLIPESITHVCVSVGTGTTLAGLLTHDFSQRNYLGFVPMKGGAYLQSEIAAQSSRKNFQLFDQWHFGGFGKVNEELLSFMKSFQKEYGIPLDQVYTGKMMFAVQQVLFQNHFPEGAKILCIHTGGLQGNTHIS